VPEGGASVGSKDLGDFSGSYPGSLKLGGRPNRETAEAQARDTGALTGVVEAIADCPVKNSARGNQGAIFVGNVLEKELDLLVWSFRTQVAEMA
jgi:hypothetical protein